MCVSAISHCVLSLVSNRADSLRVWGGAPHQSQPCFCVCCTATIPLWPLLFSSLPPLPLPSLLFSSPFLSSPLSLSLFSLLFLLSLCLFSSFPPLSSLLSLPPLSPLSLSPSLFFLKSPLLLLSLSTLPLLSPYPSVSHSILFPGSLRFHWYSVVLPPPTDQGDLAVSFFLSLDQADCPVSQPSALWVQFPRCLWLRSQHIRGTQYPSVKSHTGSHLSDPTCNTCP